jgi:hypothetical protein
LLVAACGGDGGTPDLAAGKTFDAAQLRSCLRDQNWRIEPRVTDIGVDFTTRSRSGLISADVAVERSAADAEQRVESWKDLARDADVENVEDYYFRYGNVVVAFERVPSGAARAPVERCLT